MSITSRMCVAAALCTRVALAATVPDQFYLGINMAGIADYGTEPIWKDIIMQSRTWCPQRTGADWCGGGPVNYDSLGWITSLDPDQSADMVLFGALTDNFTSMNPDSTYICTYDGTGRVSFWQEESYNEVSPGRIEVRARANAPFLKLESTTPGNHVRNIRLCLPSHEDELDSEPWHGDFLDRWKNFGVVRFMDWGRTNNSTVATWSDRTRAGTYTQAMDNGVALEHMIDYCNRTNTDPWFCIPHLADDDYVRQFATVVRDNLNPDLVTYVEYSNEIWNSMFDQTAYCNDMGVAQGLDPHGASTPWEAGWRYSGRRSGQIFDIWEEVFGGTERFVRVMGSQFSTYVTMRKLELDDVVHKTDAVAIAPYFGGGLSGDRLSDIENWTVDQILDTCLASIRGNLRTALQDFVAYLDDVNSENGTDIRLIAYEGGQHLSAWGQNQTVTDLFTAANRHPRMYELYVEYFEQWVELGGKMFCHFSSVGTPGPHGAWGALESVNQAPAEAPKYRALLDIMERYPAPTSVQQRASTASPGEGMHLAARVSGSAIVATPSDDCTVRLLRPTGAVVASTAVRAGRAVRLGTRLARGIYLIEARSAEHPPDRTRLVLH